MRITSISYGRTFNLGQFESERIDAQVQVEEGDSPEAALDMARRFVMLASAPSPDRVKAAMTIMQRPYSTTWERQEASRILSEASVDEHGNITMSSVSANTNGQAGC